jgi:hypothetical protein
MCEMLKISCLFVFESYPIFFFFLGFDIHWVLRYEQYSGLDLYWWFTPSCFCLVCDIYRVLIWSLWQWTFICIFFFFFFFFLLLFFASTMPLSVVKNNVSLLGCVWDCDFVYNKCDFKPNRRT